LPEQLTFDLPVKAVLGREDFFISKSNSLAVATLDDTGGWPHARMILCGPQGSGKSHLATIWAVENAGQVLNVQGLVGADLPTLASAPFAIEGVESIAGQIDLEMAVFHLFNLCASSRTPFLMTARAAPSRWAAGLADLASRLQSMPLVRIAPPDDALLSAVLIKQFNDRQLAVQPDVIAYILDRIERSTASAGSLVDAIDAHALQQKRPVTRHLVREVLDISNVGEA